MSYVIAAPEMMTSAATDLATIGSNVSAAHMAAAARTLAVMPAAADELSASIAQLFSQHAANHQALAAQAAAFNDQFVQHLTAGAFSYADIETNIVALLDAPLLNKVLSDVGLGLLANFSSCDINLDTTLFLALLELPFLIPFLLLTSPIWVPLLVVALPFIFALAAG
jgi:PE family